ncbi:MAG: GNAT family N-acetyltransferase [Bacteroidales bacterium]|nr:GNAT family N-acetyltransferase [Bacteroidales bacterium]
MLDFKIYNPSTKLSTLDKMNTVDFLHKHLEQYGDEKSDIEKAIKYSLKEELSFGGFILKAFDKDQLVGVVVINKTGMSGYIPENILVYIAVDSSQRGKGHGKSLMNKAIELCEGNIALHVEKDNPARFLYEKVGFTNPYLEMRLKK